MFTGSERDAGHSARTSAHHPINGIDARTVAASIPLIGWCALVLALWPASRSLPVNIVWLGGAIAGGVALYWGASVVLGLSERTALLRMFPRAEPREGVGA